MSLTRRQVLTSAGILAAGQARLSDAVSGERNAAAQVEDRAASIRIRSLTATPVGPKVFVKIETNQGVTGWGEIDQLVPRVAAVLAQSMFELLDGENPTRIEYLWQKIYRAHRNQRGGPFMVHTLAGIDMALWDLTGKLWGVPVYRVLGGPVRDKIHVYPSAKATKPGAGPAEFAGTPAELQRYVQYIRGERKKVGPDGIVIFDAHCALPPPFLIQLANALDPSDVAFIEEVAVPGNIEVFKRLKAATRIPLATGERDRTIWEFLPYLQERCIDVLQPDCAHCGGISQMRKIATLAEAYHIPLAPHCVTTDLGVSASLHATAVAPYFIIHEYYPQITPAGLVTKSWSVDRDGYASLPQGPGLGVEIDERKLEELAKKPHVFEWPTRGRLKDGSIADY
jgi:galactonate dehydratase